MLLIVVCSSSFVACLLFVVCRRWLFVVGELTFVVVRCSSRAVACYSYLLMHVDECRCLFRVVCFVVGC